MGILFMKHSYLAADNRSIRKDIGYNISKALGIKLLRMNVQGLIPKNSLVINWGRSDLGERQQNDTVFLNHPDAVENAVDKLKCYKILQDSNIPTLESTLSIADFADWIQKGNSVLGRTTERGHGGEGIHILNKNNFMDIAPHCKFFTKYYGKTYEFRVHVFKNPDGEYVVLDYQQKRMRVQADENLNEPVPEEQRELFRKIRNYNNGWVFCRENVKRYQQVEQLAIDAVKVLGLDFGAVDIGAKRGIENGEGYAVVFEVNTAPHVEGQTFDNYIAAFQKYL